MKKQAKVNGSMVSVFDVAAYILQKQGSMAPGRLHKLVYYSQAWSLVWDEEALFPEEIEAWISGPIIRDLFEVHIDVYRLDSMECGDPDALNEDQRETVDAVLKYYGDKPSQWLSDLTHIESPWKDARRGMPGNVRGNKVIPKADLAEYYGNL